MNMEKTPPLSEEEYTKMLCALFKDVERLSFDSAVALSALKKIFHIIVRIHNNFEFLIPELKELIEEQDGLRGYMSENLSPRLVSLEEKSYTKKKDVL